MWIDPDYELHLWAKWRGEIEGRGLPLEPSPVRGEARAGRPDYVDARHEEIHRALLARAALARLRAEGGVSLRQAQLLEATYLTRGAAGRAQALAPYGLAGKEGEGDVREAHAFAGLALARPKTRERRRRVRGLQGESLRAKGRAALDAARAAYRRVREAGGQR